MSWAAISADNLSIENENITEIARERGLGEGG